MPDAERGSRAESETAFIGYEADVAALPRSIRAPGKEKRPGLVVRVENPVGSLRLY